MLVAIPKEVVPGERRVALVPAAVGKLKERGLDVVVQAGAGTAATFSDEDYQARGARLESSPEALLAGADVVLKVQAPAASSVEGKHEVELLKEGATLICLLSPFSHVDIVRRLAERRVTTFAMELMPRITRAQSMDALSSMSSAAGYKAVLIAANLLPKFFPMMMTAAGTITPARVLVLGAGVAGLQAIATARRMGAVVEAFDIRPVVREQVESLGARFVELELAVEDAQDAGGYAREQAEDTQDRVRSLLAGHIKKADIVITTALVPGRKAPVLITADAARSMRPGSVIVDLAAEQGGNCELTEAGSNVVRDGVTVAGPLNLPSDLAFHTSEMYSRNISSFFLHLVKEDRLELDLEDELTRAPLVTRDGDIVNEAVRNVGSGEGS